MPAFDGPVKTGIIMRLMLPLIVGLSVAACSSQDEAIAPELACQVGTYQMDDGTILDIAPSSAGYLRWRTLDGQVGRIALGNDGIWSGSAGWGEVPHQARIELGACSDTSIRVDGIDGIGATGERIEFVIQDVRFEGAGEALAGRLVLPPGDEPVPLVVLIHGSEASSALDFAYLQRLMPAQGVAAFVYDKRGTGSSTGSYTQDFELLAADAVAALQTAEALAGDRVSAFGYLGGSQGGWVAPLATTMSDPDFVIAAFGMAEGPLAEDREQVQMELREAGYGEDVLARAREVTDATGRLLATDFREGADELARVKNAYGDEDWFGEIVGEVTGEMIKRPLWQFRAGYFFIDRGTSWDYEPVPVLNQIDTNMLWVLAGEDREAPSANTRDIITELQEDGALFDLAFFPGTDHGMVDYVEDENGVRTPTGYTQGYFRLLAEWSQTRRLTGAYGSAELAPNLVWPPRDQ